MKTLRDDSQNLSEWIDVLSLVPGVQMNPLFKVYKTVTGVGRPYKLWDPVDLESDEEILNLGRDPRVCASNIFPGVLDVLELWKGNGGERM